MRMRRSLRTKKGNTLVEFALVSVFLVPLMLGTVNVGLTLVRSVQTTQISRDAGHMFVRQVDFSLTANQDIVVRLAAGLNMTRTGGDGIVILTKVLQVGTAECTAGGVSVAQCTNLNQSVITQRLIIGNSTLWPSQVGTPADNLLNSDGTISPTNYLKQTSARATGMPGVLGLTSGESAYVSEAYFSAPAWSFPGSYPSTGTYSRTIF